MARGLDEVAEAAGPGSRRAKVKRLSRIREDKSPEQATTLAELRTLYDKQFTSKSRRDF